jgi:hypothetical protein
MRLEYGLEHKCMGAEINYQYVCVRLLESDECGCIDVVNFWQRGQWIDSRTVLAQVTCL